MRTKGLAVRNLKRNARALKSLRNKENSASVIDLGVLAQGQSLIGVMFNTLEAADDAPALHFISELTALLPANSSVAFENGANGGSFASKVNNDAAAHNEYWVDDDDIEALADGQMLTDAIAVGDAMDRVHLVFFDQGESDSNYTPANQSTENLKTVYKYIFSRNNAEYGCPIIWDDFSHRETGTVNFQVVREIMWEIAQEVGYVHLGCMIYDLPVYDQVHLTDAGFMTKAERMALVAAKVLGYNPPYADGPRYLEKSYLLNSKDIVLTIQHDGGTTLNSYTDTPIDLTPTGQGFFEVVDTENDASYTIDSVQVTGTNEVTLTLQDIPLGGFTIYGGKGPMLQLDTDNVVKDNTAHALPLRTFKDTHSITLGDPDDWLIQDYAAIFAAADTSKVVTLGSNVVLAQTAIFPRGALAETDDSAGGYNQFLGKHALGSVSQIAVTRGAAFAGTANIAIAGTAVQFPLSIVTSIQTVNVQLTGTSASATGTINSVDTDYAVALLSGVTSPSSQLHNTSHYCDVTGATQVTVTSSATVTSSTRNVQVTVIEFDPDAVDSIQKATVAIGTGAATADGALSTTVDPTRSITFNGGFRKTAGTNNNSAINFSTFKLKADGTGVTADRGASDATDAVEGKCAVVELVPGLVRVIRGETTIDSGDAVAIEEIITAPMNRSFLNVLGRRTSYTGSADEGRYVSVAAQSEDTQLTFTRTNTAGGTTLTHSWEVVSFLDAA